jgi:hypothetical protein
MLLERVSMTNRRQGSLPLLLTHQNCSVPYVRSRSLPSMKRRIEEDGILRILLLLVITPTTPIVVHLVKARLVPFTMVLNDDRIRKDEIIYRYFLFVCTKKVELRLNRTSSDIRHNAVKVLTKCPKSTEAVLYL